MQYPHWLMVAGTLLVVIGFVGFALQKNNAEPVEDVPEQEAPPEDRIVSGFAHQGPNRVSQGTDRADEVEAMVEAMSGQKRSAEQQVTDEASRKARNPMAARQKISEGQAAPEFQENRERLKAERLAREAELKAKGKKVVTWLNSPATGGRHKRMTSFEEWRKRTPAPK